MHHKNNNSGNNCRGVVILAGGDSKRLGRPKALLDFNGRTLISLMIERLKKVFADITVVTDRPELYLDLPVHLTGDILKQEGKSPLRGIHAGLSYSSHPYQFVVACDMPFLNLELIRYMARFAPSYDAVVPHTGKGYFQPLHAFYKRSCIDIIERQINRGRYKVSEFYRNLEIKYISGTEIARFDPDQEAFMNINTWDDYKLALELMAGRRESS